MRELLGRLRAACTPGALAWLAALLAAVALLLRADETPRDATALEERAARVLSQMAGAGDVQVVIRTRAGEKEATSAFAQPDAEQVPCGALAVAQGADDPLVRMQLTQALCALLGLPASAVSVEAGGD